MRNNYIAFKEFEKFILDIGFQKYNSSWDFSYRKDLYEIIIDKGGRFISNARIMYLRGNCWESVITIYGDIHSDDFKYDRIKNKLKELFSIEIRKYKIRKLLENEI